MKQFISYSIYRVRRLLGLTATERVKRWIVSRPYVSIPVGILFMVGVSVFAQSLFTNQTLGDDDDVRTPVQVISLDGSAVSGNQLTVSGEVESEAQARLSAERSGVVTRVSAIIGDRVGRGQVLVQLDTQDAQADVAQAQANLDAALAQAQSTVVGTDNATFTLQNAIEDSRVKMNEVIDTDIAQLFSDKDDLTDYGTRIQSGGVTYYISAQDFDSYLAIRESARGVVRAREALDVATQNITPETIVSAAETAEQALVETRTLLDLISRDLSDYSTESATAQSIYGGFQADISSGITTISATLSTLRNGVQSYRNAQTSNAQAPVAQAQAALASAQARLARGYIRAPFSGEVTSVSARLGESVGVGQNLVSLVNKDALRVTIQTSPDVAKQLSVGSSALVDGQYDAVVSAVASAISQTTGKVEVRVVLEDDGASLVVGEFVDVIIVPEQTDSVERIYVPLSALRVTSFGTSVFTVKDGVVHEVPVTIGDMQGENVAIISGITAEVDNVISNAQSVRVGESVEIVE